MALVPMETAADQLSKLAPPAPLGAAGGAKPAGKLVIPPLPSSGAPAEAPPPPSKPADDASTEENAENGAPKAAAGVGIIYPPPEVRNIVDKTAQFVAKNGWEFAEKVAAQKEGDAKFKFLNPASPFYAYFSHKVEQFRDGTAEASADLTVDMDDVEESAKKNTRHLEPLPEPEFTLDPPTIQAQDLDIVKLTAQFVAVNGRRFLTELSRKEDRNYQFDFLKPHHGMFHTFTTLVEQYSKILRPKKPLLDKLKDLSLDPHKLLPTVKKGADYQKHAEDERLKRVAAADAEREEIMSINWHDFVIVETLEFTGEDTNLPFPVPNPAALGARLIEAEKFERQAKLQPSGQDNTTDMDMDMDMDVEEDKPAPPAEKPAAPAAPVVAPAPKVVKIRQYDPKAAKEAKQQAPSGDHWVTSPLTGERILASKVSEHLRISLLDPRWREQKERMEAEKQKTIEQWAQGAVAVESNLKDIAARRTDIFGHGDIETEIGRKVGEREKARAEKDQADAAEAAAPMPAPASMSVSIGSSAPPVPFSAPPLPQGGGGVGGLLPTPGNSAAATPNAAPPAPRGGPSGARALPSGALPPPPKGAPPTSAAAAAAADAAAAAAAAAASAAATLCDDCSCKLPLRLLPPSLPASAPSTDSSLVSLPSPLLLGNGALT
eukprot:m.134236 g.134236  ORF g.134236 m.134236 type:complete len:661 (+) comp16912_c1_seq2:332-2314(+)